MDSFLKSVAGYLYQTYKSELQEICLVFPNRRSGLFFSRHLAGMIDKPLWMPSVRTISDLMKDISGYQLGDPLSLVFDLFLIYKKEKKTEESFDEFYSWGEMFLNDFDDIDKYLVDPKQLFQNLADLKEIENQFTLPEEQIRIIREFWTNIRLQESTSLKKDFISVWTVLYSIYTNYRQILDSKGIAYEGMMYRKVYDKITGSEHFRTSYRRFAIIGFNALNECEKEFFKYLKKNDLADFFWDYDDYYIRNTWHEAGYFLRENLVMFPQPLNHLPHDSLISHKNIEIVAVPSDISQAKVIPEILNRWGTDNEKLTETAIVLSDEQLLVPVLSSLPSDVHNVNVTLGYPLRFTPVYSFFDAIVTMHRNARKNKEGTVWFYHRDIAVLLNHPYLQLICRSEANTLLNYIIQYNRVFLNSEELFKHEYLEHLFRYCQTSQEFLEYLSKIGIQTAHLLKAGKSDDQEADFHSEYWFAFIVSLNRLNDILIKGSISLELNTFIKILRKMVNSLSIPFKGEPLAGLQIMGVLETRTIDFSNVIVLSANEGVLPKSEAAVSYIPYNLRKGFGLPTIEHQDAVYAYYFYRLIQRANNIALLYNSQSGNRSSEMSRFLFQLRYEQEFQVSEKSLNFRISLSEGKEIVIPKTDKIMEALYNNFTELSNESKYLTPTALNSYLECRLRFYFRYIAHIQEKEDVTEDIEGSMFGKLLHNAMERIYTPYLNKPISHVDFEKLYENQAFLDECIINAFASEYFKREGETPQLHGKSLVVKEVLRKYLARIIEFDKSMAPLTPLGFEQTFLLPFKIEAGEKQLHVYLGGKIDRIDKTGNTFRVIDYKTGKIDRTVAGIDRLFEISGKKQNKEAMQILFYSYLLSEDKNYKQLPVAAGLYGLRDIFKNEFDYLLTQNKNEPIAYFDQVREPFLQGLTNLLKDIFNPTQAFTQVSDKNICEYCDYRGICHR